MENNVIWWDICGRSSKYWAFWDDNISVNTSNPDLTRCFQETVLVWGPAGYLWLCLPFYIYFLWRKPTVFGYSHLSLLNLSKLILGVISVIIGVMSLFQSVADGVNETTPDPPVVMYLSPVIKILTMTAVCTLIPYEFRKGIHSSALLWFFWLLSVLCGILPFRSYILQINQSSVSLFEAWLYFLYFSIVMLQFCLAFISDTKVFSNDRQQTENERTPLLMSKPTEFQKEFQVKVQEACPHERSTVFSKINFWWLTSLIKKGYKRTLTFDDLWAIRTIDSTETIMGDFTREWNRELVTSNSLPRNNNSIPTGIYQNGNTEKVKIDMKPEFDGKRNQNRGDPSLTMALWRSCGWALVEGGVHMIFFLAFNLGKPLLLQVLLSYMNSATEFQWQGFLLAGALFFVSFCVTAFVQHALNSSYILGMRFRTAVTAAVYRKALRINSQARKNTTVGEIVNLMSVDAQKLQDAPQNIHWVWGGPLMIALVSYFLYQLLGVAAFAGLATLVVITPFNTIYVGKKVKSLQTEQMIQKDKRIKLMSEILNGVKVLKLYGWEESFQKKVTEIRNKELSLIRTAQLLNAATSMTWFCGTFIVSLVSFTVFLKISDENILTADRTFVSLSLINLLDFPMTVLPQAVMGIAQAMVSTKRIKNFLQEEEINDDNVKYNPSAENAISVQGGEFSWDLKEAPTLKGIDVTVPEGRLIAIVGQVGSGKTSLISAFLGEMVKLKGSVQLKSNIAYVPQQAWIQYSTLKENILFAQGFKREKYDKILEACALLPDLEILPGGDNIEIGEKGINLSGGQKQRVSLARAAYQDLDIYLLDDPLSAVDSHVGKHIFEKVIGPNGLLKNKTRVFVTHGISYLPHVDQILVMNDGRISEQGSYTELLNNNGAFADFLRVYINENEDEEDEDADQLAMLREHLSTSEGSGSETNLSDDGLKKRKRRRSSRRDSAASGLSGLSDSDAWSLKRQLTSQTDGLNNVLIEEESAGSGGIGLSILKTYIQAGGPKTFLVIIITLSLYTAARVGGDIWLSAWADDGAVNGTQDVAKTDFRLGVYGAFGAGQVLSVIIESVGVALASVSASKVLHDILLESTFHNPMSFFDTTPLGRIMNRFSKDVDTIDVNVPLMLQAWLQSLAPVFATIVAICYSTPIFIVVAIPLFILFILLQRVYIVSGRQLKRIDAVQRSPIYSHFGESLLGTSSIRAFRQQKRFIAHSDQLLDNSQAAWFPVLTSYRWIGVYLEILGHITVFFAALFAVLQKDTISASLAGLSLTYALRVTLYMILMLRSQSELETYIVSVERIKEYADTPNEAPWFRDEVSVHSGWPNAGAVRFKDYETRYRPGLDLVLKGVNFEIKPGEKVGIVGRTGAGKSSLTLALFRLIEGTAGGIFIDGVSIHDLGLHQLRCKLTIIPQDPVVFSGTLRMNIDPAEEYSDPEIWSAVENAHLKDYATSLSKGLDHECGEEGQNLSIGQRQLLCLARALLRRSKILVLDEATSACDLETDDLIQNTIRVQFKHSTVLTIAHRLNTIMDYDRVMVLEAGKVKEFDSPHDLLQKKRSLFFSMARDAGLV
ncbi:unnamed protein product [Owenia fusiformis]|uniref:ABC-type glutathione-S-conjugate transporter n=1 Tax=Owenia fusiformis TaxID=6347 RepID=A0A8S4PUS2_OWEFU|nr:unnamed protein product [Owenia fusiformis]